MKKRVGLTGGIGSGKSEVARILEKCGAFVIDTDLLAREAVSPNSDGLRAIAHAWPGVVRGGQLDRGALGEIIFSDRTARERLNAIVHPFVRQLAGDREQHAKADQIVVHMVPLLFETAYNKRCDANVLVIAPDDQRLERVMRRDHLSEAQVRARMSSQINPQEAKLLATYCIENDGDLHHLEERTQHVFRQLESET